VHVSNLIRKLGVGNRYAAAAIGSQLGLARVLAGGRLGSPGACTTVRSGKKEFLLRTYGGITVRQASWPAALARLTTFTEARYPSIWPGLALRRLWLFRQHALCHRGRSVRCR
jgi:hypothetical protein